MVFPVGTYDKWSWCYAKVVEAGEMEQMAGFGTKLDMENAEFYDSFLSAIKNVNGFSLGEFSQSA